MSEKRMSEEGHRAAEAVKETAQEWKGKASAAARDWGERAREKARNAGAAADLYVHEYAWTSVAMVALVAGVLGYLLGSSRERS